MKLQIDNLDGRGFVDYTSAMDGTRSPRVVRDHNKGAELEFSLIAVSPTFVVPATGARVILGKTNGQDVFTGYLTQAPSFEYLGWGERGPLYRYNLVARSDETLLDEKRTPDLCAFVARSAGGALQQLTQDVRPATFDTSSVQNLDELPSYSPSAQNKWSEQALEIARQARGTFRILNGALSFASTGVVSYALNESDPHFTAGGLKLQSVSALVNDMTVIGEVEPKSYVRDYFVGDGVTLKFHLSQAPFTKRSKTIFDEEYVSSALNPTLGNVTDPTGAISLSAGKLQLAGGTGSDGATTVAFVELVELGGVSILQHGDVMFSAASRGIVGGLYTAAIGSGFCLSGFQITPGGSESNIQAIVQGFPVGPTLSTIAGHHYVLTTRLYSLEIYREQQVFHSSVRTAGSGGWGGSTVLADVRMVLEVHDIDPANSGSLVAPSSVLFDGVIANAPAFCNYAPVNASNMQCAIAFTRFLSATDTEVRSALPGVSYRTRLVGALSEGAECTVISGSTLDFYPQYVPAPNELIEVHYRGSGRAMARVTNPASIAAQQRPNGDGVYGAVRHIKRPSPRTTTDCENAAIALLDDSVNTAWEGEYEVWSDFLPAAASDIFPGDALIINVPSRNAGFQSIVSKVEIVFKDPANDRSVYRISFANDAAKLLAIDFEAARISTPLNVVAVDISQVGGTYLPPLRAAAITQIGSTSASVDAGTPPPVGGGIEVRWSDLGWGLSNDRNLAGRFSNQLFTLPRLSRSQTYYLRQYDASTPPKYSRYSSALHIDYPL